MSIAQYIERKQEAAQEATAEKRIKAIPKGT